MTPIDSLFSSRVKEGLSKDSPTPLYHQLFDLLRSMILDGTLSRDDRMPSDEQLARAFDVSRITAKRAMDELAAAKLVKRQRGKGTHVIFDYKPPPVQEPLVGMLQEIESLVRSSTARVLTCEMLKPPAHIREELGLQADETALRLIRTRQRKGLTFGYYASWTKGVALPKRPSVFVKTPRLTYFKQQGLEVSYATQVITAVAATPEVADALSIKEGSPLLSLTRRCYDQEGSQRQLRDYLNVLYNPELFQYQMDLSID